MRKQPAKAKSEDSPAYISTPAHAALPSHADALRALEGMPTDWVVSYAIDRVQADLPTAGPMMGGPAAVREYLVLKNASHADQMVERFSVLFLDSQHRVLALETIFTGTLTQTSVYPREVVRAAIRLNAAAVVLSHNHPSGSPTPSQADGVLTRTLKSTLGLIDVTVLDHIIVAGAQSASMAELGLKRELAMLEYATQNQMNLDDVKAKLSDTTIKANLQRELASMNGAGQALKPPTEPPGRAAPGRAYEQ